MTYEKYEEDGKFFWIVDGELKLDFSGELGTLDEETFANGAPRYCCYRKENALHGPSTYFSQDGTVLSKTWYFEGKKVGKLRRYYPNGKLYCLERYVDGVPHLDQEYFYLDGSIKTRIQYSHGKFHGETKLFWPDGQLKRKCLFNHGEKEGEDIFYDEEGQPVGALEHTVS